MTDMTVAKTILSQLGGNRFAVMTGARNFIGGDNYLAFKLPRYAGVKVNHVKIILDPSDTYTVEFSRVYGTKFTQLAKHTDVYCDMLAQIFEDETGLYTSL